MYEDKSEINDLTYGICIKYGCTDKRQCNSESKVSGLLSIIGLL
jgi:hypothetical protein